MPNGDENSITVARSEIEAYALAQVKKFDLPPVGRRFARQ